MLRVSQLRTGEIHTDGGIPEATPDLISGGVFVISGAEVEQVTNAGPVTTNGQLATSGDDVTTVEIEGRLERLDAGGGIYTAGKRSDAVHIAGDVAGLDLLELHAADDQTLVRTS